MHLRLASMASALLMNFDCAAVEPTVPTSQITFSCYAEEKTEFFPVLFELYQQAFDNLGYSFAMRSINLAKANNAQRFGRLDGMCARTLDFSMTDSAKSMVRIDTLLSANSTRLWTHSTQLQKLSIEEIISGNYTVGFVRNHAAAASAVQQLGILNYRSPNSFTQLIDLLENNRLDYIILIDAEVKMLNPLLGPRPLLKGVELKISLSYPYLHQRHSHLAEPLAAQLQQILSNPKHPLHELVNTEIPGKANQ